MLSKLFFGMSLLGAEWVLYILILLSILSVAVIAERVRFYRRATSGIGEFRASLRRIASGRKWDEASKLAEERLRTRRGNMPDLESEMALALISHPRSTSAVLSEVAHDAITRAKLAWESKLFILATIGNNAPFIGLFGTVLGIIKAFHDLSRQSEAGAHAVTAGISEALVATAVGILLAIPAVVAFNTFQRRVKSGLSEAEALKSYLIGLLAE
jgi:biopolymer transport protein ExbB